MPTMRRWIPLLPVLAGCTRVVSLEVDSGPTRLVVEGRIELRPGDGGGRQTILLTTTDRFDAIGPLPPATGATVVVQDDQGRQFVFSPSPIAGNPAYITTGLTPRVGGRYLLTIDYQGERYRAEHQLLAPPPLDSLYFRYEDAGLAQGDSGFRAVIDYTDPAGVKNYYLWELLVDGERRIAVDPGNRFRIISDDRFYDGGEVKGYQPYDEEVVEPGQVVTIRQLALSEAGFRYHFVLFEQTTGGGGPFSTPPTSVRGNVVNLTDPARYPLGFFFATQVAERSAVVPAR
ncbi:MAG: DUF4249 domain-containing protein [Gemmatimonadetes bacterium]|nr:DUF4249 domain-containing protein [Gemmatimonadota bacterium]